MTITVMVMVMVATALGNEEAASLGGALQCPTHAARLLLVVCCCAPEVSQQGVTRGGGTLCPALGHSGSWSPRGLR